MDFLEGDSAFFDFPKTQEGGYVLPGTNPPLASIPSPRLNFNFRGNMAANQPWLTITTLSTPSPQNPLLKHPEKIMPKFDPDKDILPEDHIKQFMLTLNLINV